MSKDANHESDNRDPAADGNNQPDVSHAPLGAEEIPRLRSPCRIRVIHHRNRLIDPDNLNAKAAIDQVVALGILASDSAQCVTEVTHRQVKVGREEPEKTVIEIEEVK